MRRFAPQLFAQLFCIALAVFTIPATQAQILSAGTPQKQDRDRELLLDILRQRARPQPPARETRLNQPSVRADFRQLQIVNNNLIKRVFEPSPAKKITNKEIRSSLGEIRKLAKRLSDDFAIPASADKAESQVALTAGLLQLDKAVMSFVDNPMFHQLRVYDAEMVSQAGKDLSEVMRLADVLRSLAKDH